MRMKAIMFFVCAAVFLGQAAAVRAAEFSADMVNTAGGRTFQGKIYMGGNKVRMETAEGVTITRMDKKVVWILMPQDKMYMEQAFDRSKAPQTSEKVEGEVERKKIGTESINGRQTDKYEIVYMADNKKETMFQWILPEIKMPVKMMVPGKNGWSMEYKNLKTGKQPDPLFEVPAGYEKFSMQMPSMKDMFKKGFGE
ncbi:MAG TPA: DUF4412 domain-containing protein [Candidatus Omnitrophota bacterium]|nr:DUF4412 domain-containing protein [Candidatus Omnitrophota bacterium]HQO37571.1 DUF4412 domain-containing protein [Candidatus Omnitrophota bacterium]